VSDQTPEGTTPEQTSTARPRRRAAGRPAGPPGAAASATTPPDAVAVEPTEVRDATAPAKKSAARKSTKKAVASAPDGTGVAAAASADSGSGSSAEPAAKAARTAKPARAAKATKTAKTAKAPAARTTGRKATAARTDGVTGEADAAASHLAGEVAAPSAEAAPARRSRSRKAVAEPAFSAVPEPVPAETPASSAAGLLMFQAPSAEAAPAPRKRAAKKSAPATPDHAPDETDPTDEGTGRAVTDETADADAAADALDDDGPRRRRRRGGRGRRRKPGEPGETSDSEDSDEPEATDASTEPGAESSDDESDEGGSSRRRRRRRRRNGEAGDADNDPPNTVVRVREPRTRSASSEVTSVKGSTRLEAKKQRRREGREAGRRRPSILTEAEFLARREAVDRVMIVRQRDDRTQIAVLEDGVLVEHYVNRSTGGSMIGNVYLGKVQNVLPSMEAAFVDVGRGRNAVLYAGEVNWDAAGLKGQPKRIEAALKSGDPVLVQVTKDPLGHKGARLTSQISLPGRFLVYVPEGSMTGISRKLPDTERVRLKSILRQVVPEDAGVIVRTAAEGASEDELRRDVERLAAQWEDLKAKADKASGGPALLHGEPDLAIKVVRDIFNEDFGRLVVEGDAAWTEIEGYVTGVAPDLADRVQKWVGPGDLFTEYRVDEQLAKALDRKVWLPSGGSLVIDRTEAMTVVDVNTGKFTGQGGNLEETVTKNNLEAAEEIVRQLRLRDVGGIIVVDFIDMVLENNRDLVLRRLIECLGRDRTKHQVAEVTSLGLVQMTRKRIGQGLLEVFSETCETCQGRGYHVHSEPVVAKAAVVEAEPAQSGRGRRRKGEDRPRATTPEVEPRVIDPKVSQAMEKVHAAAAKRAALAASGGSPEEVAVAEAELEVAEAAAAALPVDAVSEAAATDEVAAGEVSTGSSTADTTPDEPDPAASPGDEESSAAPAEPAPAASTTRPRKRGPRKATRPSGPAAPVEQAT
jgi:ribonuclease E